MRYANIIEQRGFNCVKFKGLQILFISKFDMRYANMIEQRGFIVWV
jgi:hypothetical protein